MKTIHIYSDESRHKGERFLLLGAMWILEENVPILNERMAAIRKKYGYEKDDKWIDFRGEIKWQKVSTKYLPVYKEVVDLFFDLIDEHVIRFCCMLVDTHDQAVKQHNNIKTDGFYKLLYQLYLHNCQVPGLYKVYPDRITNARHDVNLETLKRTLGSGLRHKFEDKVNPLTAPKRYVLEITPQESHKHESIQMVDLIMGALGYFQNRHFKVEGAKSAKVELMEYVFNKLVFSGAFKIEGKNYMVVRSTRLNIWLFRPRNKNNPQ